MAAALDPASNASLAELIDLRDVRSPDLGKLLDEEIDIWDSALDWDFHASAELVRRFVDQRSLSGYAFASRGDIAGYCYYVHDEGKGLIGDLFVRQSPARPEQERRLLAAVIEQLMRTSYVHRIETQLMLASLDLDVPGERFAKRFDRNFMRMELPYASRLPAKQSTSFYVAQWEEWHQEPAAQLIPAAYRGHIDSDINDQYDTVGGARRFLYNIVQYPGCGAFFKPASYVALDRQTGALGGICLSSLVARHSGHITQLCVAPAYRNTGMGYELLRRSLLSLHQAGCEIATLTVTSANREAIRLYERVGFETTRNFRAFVWQGF